MCVYILVTVIAMSIIYGPAGGGWHYSLPNPLNISLSINALKLLALVLFPYSESLSSLCVYEMFCSFLHVD